MVGGGIRCHKAADGGMLSLPISHQLVTQICFYIFA